MNEPIIGRIIKVSRDGWGFISSKEIKFTRIFFHWTALKQDTISFPELKNGMTVEFTPVKVEGRGYRAIHVKVIPTVREEKKEDKKEESDVNPSTTVSSLPE